MKAMGNGVRMRVTVVSHPGVVREVNEDCIGIGGWTISSPTAHTLQLDLAIDCTEPVDFVVADGLGGHEGGADASSIAVGTFLGASGTLDSRVDAASSAIHERVSRDPTLRGMGTTLVGLRVEPFGSSVVFNVGDSRAYRFTEGYLGQLSVDDRPTIQTGSSKGIVTQVIGGRDRTAIDVHESPVTLGVGDRILLCTDGLSDVLDDDQISDCLTQSAAEAAKQLLAATLSEGAPDNVSFLIIDLLAQEDHASS